MRIRVDFCSRPPRTKGINKIWENAVHKKGVDIVDAETLILLKQTRRVRDYSIIGALAEVLGYKENIPEIALEYLQDFELLKRAVEKWPDKAKKSQRAPVRLLLSDANRKEVVAAIAIEQDEKIQQDESRIKQMIEKSKTYQKKFAVLKAEWKKQASSLLDQHRQLINAAESLL
jgi:hypothetical protein